MRLREMQNFLFGTLRGRLILGVALVHAVMMTLFIIDLTGRQRAMLLEHQVEDATNLADSLATSAAVWIASYDVAGLQELVESERNYPELVFATLTDNEGRILAHSDTSRRGQFLLDLPGERRRTVLQKTVDLVDVLSPVQLGGRQVGWARVGISQKAAGTKLAEITGKGALYALAAIFSGVLIAWQMGRRITQRLYAVQKTIRTVKSGDRTARCPIAGTDEAAAIATEFNILLDSLDAQDAALAKGEIQYRRLVDTSNEGIWVLGADALTTFVNARMGDMLGCSSGEMLGRPLSDFIFPEDVPDHQIRMANRRRGLAEHYERCFRHRDGQPVWTLVSAVPIMEAEGTFIGSFAMFADITERKHAEAVLAEQERHAQSLLRLSRRLERAQTYDQALDAARDEVNTILGYENLWVYLLSEDKQYAKVLMAGGPMGESVLTEAGAANLTIRGDQMLEEIAAEKEIVIVEDARTDPRTNKEIVAKLGNRTIVNVPICLMDMHLGSVGTGTFGDEGVRVPSPSEREYLAALASHLAVTLDWIRLLNQRQQAEVELRQLNEELEQRVQVRTAELEKRNHELELMNKAFVGRELRMVELKERIKALEKASAGDQPDEKHL